MSPVVYDTILSAIHNDAHMRFYANQVVYDTILSAIHNRLGLLRDTWGVVYDTILSAIHNCQLILLFESQLYMIRFSQLFTTSTRS